MLRKYANLVCNAVAKWSDAAVDHQTTVAVTHRPRAMAAMGDQAIVTADSEKDIESTATGGSSDKVSPQSGERLYLMLSCISDPEISYLASQNRPTKNKIGVHQRFILCEFRSSASSAYSN